MKNVGRRLFVLISILLVYLHVSWGQQAQASYPGRSWQTADPLLLGWSESELATARKFFATLPSASLIVIDRGRLIIEWGDPARKVKVSSVRKSFLSALFGIAEAEGKVNLNSTLAELGIDDVPPLEEVERQATVRMLLQSRSGVYHGYVAGTPNMRLSQPQRGSHSPGTFWYYNNWDFNALGTIYEKVTKTKIGESFRDRLASPLGMQDFRLEDMYYEHALPDAQEPGQSVHPAYHLRLTARDMARFGYLFLRKGKWNDQQIIPSRWIEESTRSYSSTDSRGTGYGFLWWLNFAGLPVKSFSAEGALAKSITVVPDRDLVIVYQNHAEFPDAAQRMSDEQISKLQAATRPEVAKLLLLLLDAQNIAR